MADAAVIEGRPREEEEDAQDKAEAEVTRAEGGPSLRVLSLGAGVQSTALLILVALAKVAPEVCLAELRRILPAASDLELEALREDFAGLECAIFSDTGWEPRSVYEHLGRLEETVARPAGIPIYRVGVGNIRDDALDPEHRFASMPLYVLGPCDLCGGEGSVTKLGVRIEAHAKTKWIARLKRAAGIDPHNPEWTAEFTGKCPKCEGSGKQEGMTRRQCTSEYKLKPIKAKVRELLGAEMVDYPCPSCKGVGRLPAQEAEGTRAELPERMCHNCEGDGDRPRYGNPPKGKWAEQWVGISRDEFGRAKDSDVRYARNRFPLLEANMTREDCVRFLTRQGWGATPKSACIGCPFHGNRQWRALRDESPEEWADAVAFDAAIRAGNLNPGSVELLGQAYLHRSRVPLSEAPIDRVTSVEWADRQVDLFGAIADAELEAELGAEDGCGPFSCRTDGN